jgi:diguanylate cyclase (GGDEF)-like protein/PAS domain S-box-containing protein
MYMSPKNYKINFIFFLYSLGIVFTFVLIELISDTQHHLLIGMGIIVLSLVANIFASKIVAKRAVDLAQTNELNKQLQKANDLFNEVEHSAKIGFWKLDGKSKEFFWSDGMYEILSLKKGEEKPHLKLFLSLLYEKDRDYFEQEFLASLEQKTDLNVTCRLLDKYNKLRYVQIKATHHYNNLGEYLNSVGNIHDETEVIIAQKSIEKYIELVDKNIITSSTDLNGLITYASEAFCEISGYSREELIGRTHSVVRHPESPKETFKEMWKEISQGRIWKGELKNLKKNGGFYWVDTTIYPLYDEMEVKTGYTAIRVEITNKKLLEKIAITDGLTDIFNRRHFNELFGQVINSSKRNNELVAFMMIDIDHFKLYNDTYGHQLGDSVLKAVASAIKSTLNRADDYCFRLGGEEFGVLFKPKNKEQAVKFAKKINVVIEALQIVHEKNNVSKYVTISMGLVCKNALDIRGEDAIYHEADGFLYQAKNRGRNQVFSDISI